MGDKREVAVSVPEKERQVRQPPLHGPEEHRSVSLQNGPVIAFTNDAVRVYDNSFEEFVELSDHELLAILARIYGMGCE